MEVILIRLPNKAEGASAGRLAFRRVIGVRSAFFLPKRQSGTMS